MVNCHNELTVPQDESTRMCTPHMRVFLTGATGYVGSAVLDAVLRGGHEVSALVRHPKQAKRLQAREVNAIVGNLSAPDGYTDVAHGCDAIIHAAFESSAQGPSIDRLATTALLAAASRRAATGHAATFIYTSSAWVLGNSDQTVTEDAAPAPTPLMAWRPEHEMLVEAATTPNLRTAIVRPGIVYGGARGIVGDLLMDAANGLLRIVGDGKNHWACVYDRDLADVYALIVISANASGIYHVNDEGDEQVLDLVESIARYARTHADLRHMPIAEARTKMGPLADALALDQVMRSRRSRALGWTPTLRSIAGNVARLIEEHKSAEEAA